MPGAEAVVGRREIDAHHFAALDVDLGRLVLPRMLAQRDDAVGRAEAIHAPGELALLVAGAGPGDTHQVGDEVVLVLFRHHSGVGRHRDAVHAGFERADDLALGPPGPVRAGLREVARVDVTALAVDHLVGRGADAAAVFAVALRALHFGVELAAVGDATRAARRIGQRHRRARPRGGETRLERLDVIDQCPALLVVQQVLPRRHARPVGAA